MEFIHESNRIYVKNEKNEVIAEVTFPSNGDDYVTINHTFVDPSLRGMGIAGKLMELAVSDIRQNKKKAKLTCSYAIRWFDEHPENNDLI